MKEIILKIISIFLTVMFVIIFFTVDKDVVFTSYVGILLLAFMIVIIYITSISIFMFEEKDIENGKKHKEKPMVFVLMFIFVVFVISMIYAIPYSGSETWFSIWSLVTLLLFIIVVMVLSYIMNYVVIEETSLTYIYVGFAKKKTVQFADIEEIKFGGLMNTFKLKTKDSWYLIDVSLKNADEVLNAIYSNTTNEMHRDAFRKLEKFYTLFFLKSNIQYLDFFKNLEIE